MQEEIQVSPSPCVLVSGAVLLAFGIALYFGHKYWKSYGVTPEEFVPDLS